MKERDEAYDNSAAIDWVCDNVCEAAFIAETVARCDDGIEDVADFQTFLDGFIAGVTFFAVMLGKEKPCGVPSLVANMLSAYKVVG